jgi:hypothetical protein
MISYSGTGAVALCGPEMLLLLAVEPESPLVSALWPAVLRTDLPGVLGILAASGIDRLPDFGLTFSQPPLTRVLLRGSIEALITHPGSSTEPVSAGQVATWHEKLFLTELAGVCLSLPGIALADRAFPLVAGVVLAGIIEQSGPAAPIAFPAVVPAFSGSSSSGSHASPQPPLAPSAGVAASTPDFRLPLNSQSSLAGTGSGKAGQVGAALLGDGSLQGSAGQVPPGADDPVPHVGYIANGHESGLVAGEPLSPPSGVVGQPVAGGGWVPDGAPTTGADRPAAPVRPSFAEAPVPSASSGSKQMKGRLSWLDDGSEPAGQVGYGPSAAASYSGGPSAGGQSYPAGGQYPAGGSPDGTYAVGAYGDAQATFGDLGAAYASGRRSDTVRRDAGPEPVLMSSRPAVRVRAIRCPAGHYNPQGGLADCRECGLPVEENQLPEEIDQPPLGVLRREGTSESWVLSEAVTVIGREPRASGESAAVIHTANASQNVSRIHAEVRLNGWHVEVVDRSTHGTQIVNPGGEPVRLERDQPVRILPGARLVLANDVFLRYEVS